MRICRGFIRVCGTAIAVVTVGHASATMQAPAFKVAGRTVAVYATVSSEEGRMVTDLPRDAFSVLDNGKPQPLTVFSSDSQPITVVVLLDRSGSMLSNFKLVEQAAEHFVASMLPADKARIGSFSNGVQVDPVDFTSDHDKLLRILRTDLQPEGPTPLWNAVNVGISALTREQGRRVILVFTDGVDSPGNASSDNFTLGSVMSRAEAEDVMVYAIGLAGQNGPSSGSGGGGFGGGRGHSGGGPGSSQGRPAAGRAEKPDGGLLKIATATGGGYFELTSTADLGATFSRVADELHHQYALGFSPTLLDGKTHSLEVRVAGTGLTVRARKSYLATAQEAPPPALVRAVSAEALEAALGSMSITGASSIRAIRTWIGMSRGELGRTRVQFVWEPAAKTPGVLATESATRVSIVATGPDDVVYFDGSSPELPSSIKDDTPFASTFDVAPGPLRIHITVEDAASKVLGSETRTMTANDFSTSSIGLGTVQLLRARTFPEYQVMSLDPKATPAVTREFNKTDRVIVRVPVYGQDDGAAMIHVRLLNQTGYASRELPVKVVGTRDVQQAEIPVASLAPGVYVVQVMTVGDANTEPHSELIAFHLGS